MTLASAQPSPVRDYSLASEAEFSLASEAEFATVLGSRLKDVLLLESYSVVQPLRVVSEEVEAWSEPGRGGRAKQLNMRASKQPMRTFLNDDLEQAFVSYCQLACPQSLSAGKIAAKRIELLRKSADFMHMEEFDLPEGEQLVCGSEFLETIVDPFEDLQAGMEDLLFAKMCTHRLLDKHEEARVIMRMHYYKFLAHRLLSAANVDQWALARAEGLIRASQWHRGLIVHANIRLIVSIIRKLTVSPSLYDDLISDGIVGLLRALDRFDPCRGYRFCTYATTVIRRECIQCLQERSALREQFSTSATLSVLGPVKGINHTKSDRTHYLVWRKKLMTLLNKLSPREKSVLRFRYGLGATEEGMTLQKLADKMKLSKERIRQIEFTALRKLKTFAAKKVHACEEDTYEWPDEE